MIDRDTLLREIGLTPIWRSRERLNNQIPVQNITDAATPSAYPASPLVAEPVVTDPAARGARIAALDWDALNKDIAECRACKLCKTRSKAVPGVGHRAPTWMVVGASPNDDDDKQGAPFVGRVGALLDQMLAAVSKSRKQNVFITNVVKCLPPNNRNPEPEEIAACAPYLERQIALASPKLFLALGEFAGQTLLEPNPATPTLNTAPCERNGIAVVITHRPADLLISPQDKASAWANLVAAQRLSAEPT